MWRLRLARNTIARGQHSVSTGRYDLQMSNPAALLHELLTRWNRNGITNEVRGLPNRDDQAGWRQMRQAIKHLDALDQLLSAQVAQGRRVSAYVNVLPSLTAAVFAYQSGWNQHSRESIRESDLALLDALAGQVDDWLVEPSAERFESITPFLNRIGEVLAADLSIPEDLRVHIAGLILHVRGCIENYAITGAFDLQVALDRLIAAVGYAGAQSDEPSRWKAAAQNFAYPFTVSVLASPIGTMLTQLTAGGG